MTNEQKSAIAETIKRARKKIGKTQNEVAIELDVHISSVKRWESGKLLPSLETLFALAVALDKPAWSLVYIPPPLEETP